MPSADFSQYIPTNPAGVPLQPPGNQGPSAPSPSADFSKYLPKDENPAPDQAATPSLNPKISADFSKYLQPVDDIKPTKPTVSAQPSGPSFWQKLGNLGHSALNEIESLPKQIGQFGNELLWQAGQSSGANALANATVAKINPYLNQVLPPAMKLPTNYTAAQDTSSLSPAAKTVADIGGGILPYLAGPPGDKALQAGASAVGRVVPGIMDLAENSGNKALANVLGKAVTGAQQLGNSTLGKVLGASAAGAINMGGTQAIEQAAKGIANPAQFNAGNALQAIGNDVNSGLEFGALSSTLGKAARLGATQVLGGSSSLLRNLLTNAAGGTAVGLGYLTPSLLVDSVTGNKSNQQNDQHAAIQLGALDALFGMMHRPVPESLAETPAEPNPAASEVQPTPEQPNPQPAAESTPAPVKDPMAAQKESLRNDITQIDGMLQEREQGIANQLKQAHVDALSSEDSLYKQIRDNGGIAPSKTDALKSEYNESVPLAFKNSNGMPLDEMASSLGMDSKTLLDKLRNAKRTEPDYEQEAKKVLANDEEYQGLNEYKNTLQGHLDDLNSQGIQAMRTDNFTSPTVPFRNAPLQSDRQITRQKIINNMRKNLGVTIRTGRLHVADPAVRGYFKVDPEVIRTRQDKDIQVIAHEIGHALDKRFNLENPAYDAELMKLGQNTSGKNYTPDQIRKEGVAEYIRLHLTDPEKAQAEAPNYTQYFNKQLPDKIQKGLAQSQHDIDTWITQGLANQFRGQVDRGGNELKQPMGQRISEKAHDLYTQTVDKFHPLARVETELTGAINSAENSLYKQARLSANAPRVAEQFIEHNLKPVLKEAAKKGIDSKDLLDYALAVHSRDVEANGIQSGFTKDQIDAVIKKFGTKDMEALRKQLVDYNHKLLDFLVKDQVLSQENADFLKQKYPNYVPMNRSFEDHVSGNGPRNARGFVDLSSPIKRLQGSTRDIVNPLESMVKNTFTAINTGIRNRVGLQLDKLADVPGAGKFVERLAGNTRDPKDQVITVFKHGERVQLQLDPELYKAMKQLDQESMGVIVKILSKPANLLRAGSTLTPQFMARNPIKDNFEAYVYSNYGYNPIIDLPKGIFHVFKEHLVGDDVYKKWVESGGGFGESVSQDRNLLQQQIKGLAQSPTSKFVHTIISPVQWINLLRTVSEVFEEGTKVGAFNKALKKGATPEEAAFESRDLMDFARSGSKMKQANAMVAFLNANIQGIDKMARVFKNNPVRSTIRALIGVTLPTLALYYWNTRNPNQIQRKNYENIPDWERNSFFIIPIPGTNELARIPKPFDLAPIFSTIPEQIARFIDKDNPKTGNVFWENLLSQYSIPVMMSGLTPIIEDMSNYSFFMNGPIVPQRLQGLMPKDQYTPNTTLTSREIGQMTNLPPLKIDNAIQGYAGGLGKIATSGIDQLISGLGLMKGTVRPTQDISQNPFLAPFMVNTTGGGQAVNDFYDQYAQLSQQYQSAKQNRTPMANAQEYAVFKASDAEMSKLNQQYRQIQANNQMTPEQKKSYMDQINQYQIQVAQRALNTLKK